LHHHPKVKGSSPATAAGTYSFNLSLKISIKVKHK
jgi:hypothetical protein